MGTTILKPEKRDNVKSFYGKAKVKEEDGKKVPDKLSIKLNQNFGNLKFKPIKKAERDSLYVALDLAEYWLKEALELDP